MKLHFKPAFLFGLFLAVFAGTGLCQSSYEDLKNKVDVVVSEAYQSAAAAFPCKIKAGGDPKMMSWEGIEKCFYKADERIDWEDLNKRIREIRDKGRYETTDVLSAVESSLTRRALIFDSVFSVKKDEVLLPLSNSILRHLPENSLMDLSVYDKSGRRVGTFAGGYTYERMGEISGNRQLHSLFQYTDANGKIHSSSDRLLLDSFGVPWKEASSQPGFRLNSDKFMPKH
ncbi:MAG: hypothetical protein JXA73_06535 [Acidobacteria bacterium]|nr:hypothetical protein [Acidobacteriota bacterium]